jgi:hypothetical protein
MSTLRIIVSAEEETAGKEMNARFIAGMLISIVISK